MTGVMGQGRYDDTGLPLVEKCKFPGKRWWEAFNTDQIQGEDEITYGKMSHETPEYIYTEQKKDRWGIRSKLEGLCDAGYREIRESALYDMLDIPPSEEGPVKSYILDELKLKKRYTGGELKFIFSERIFRERTQKEEVLV